MNLGSMNKSRPYFSITDFAQLNQTSVAGAIGPSITSSSTDFPFQNLVLGNSFEFSAAEKHKICLLFTWGQHETFPHYVHCALQ
jgi:hypothetical protein